MDKFSEEAWVKRLLKIYKALTKMETVKHQEPIYSKPIDELYAHYRKNLGCSSSSASLLPISRDGIGNSFFGGRGRVGQVG
jgi:hypothetical protein